MQVFFTSGITNAVNERGILSGSPAGGSMILFSYQRFKCGCELLLISQSSEVNDDQH